MLNLSEPPFPHRRRRIPIVPTAWVALSISTCKWLRRVLVARPHTQGCQPSLQSSVLMLLPIQAPSIPRAPSPKSLPISRPHCQLRWAPAGLPGGICGLHEEEPRVADMASGPSRCHPAPAKGVVPHAGLPGRLSFSREALRFLCRCLCSCCSLGHNAHPLPLQVLCEVSQPRWLVASSAVLRERRDRTKPKPKRQATPKSRPGSCWSA